MESVFSLRNCLPCLRSFVPTIIVACTPIANGTGPVSCTTSGNTRANSTGGFKCATGFYLDTSGPADKCTGAYFNNVV
jgi:hypothetical protein